MLLWKITSLLLKIKCICPLALKGEKDAMEHGMNHHFGSFHNVDAFGYDDIEGSERFPTSGFGNHPFGNHDAYHGFKDNYSPGDKKNDCKRFGMGSLNNSYSKNYDGSFYGLSDRDPFIGHTLGDFGMSATKHGSSFDSRMTWSGSWGKRREYEINENYHVLYSSGYGLVIPKTEYDYRRSWNSARGYRREYTGSGMIAEAIQSNAKGKSVRGLAANGASQSLGSRSSLQGGGLMIGGVSNSGVTAAIFRFTEHSKEGILSNYNRSFSSSKLLVFIPLIDGLYKITLVSVTKGFHPQLKISEINKEGGDKYIEQNGEDKDNGIYSSQYQLRSGAEYVLEIGISEKLDFTHFEDVKRGGFICLITSEKKSFQQILAEEDYRISVWGRSAIVPYKIQDHWSFLEMGKNKDLSHWIIQLPHISMSRNSQ